MNKEILTRSRIAKLILDSYSSRSMATIVFVMLLCVSVIGIIASVTLLATVKDPSAQEELGELLIPFISAMTPWVVVLTLVLIFRTKRWNRYKRDVEKGKFYELREVTLREVVATPKAFDKCSYTMYFDGCSAYDVPADNYAWSKTKRCGAEAMYKNSKPREKFYALIREEGALVVGVFSAKHFDIEPLACE